MVSAGASLAEDIAQFVRDPQADELDAALLVGRALTDTFNSPSCRDHMNRLADGCPQGSDPWTYLGELGFAGSRGDADVVRDSRLKP